MSHHCVRNIVSEIYYNFDHKEELKIQLVPYDQDAFCKKYSKELEPTLKMMRENKIRKEEERLRNIEENRYSGLEI